MSRKDQLLIMVLRAIVALIFQVHTRNFDGKLNRETRDLIEELEGEMNNDYCD